MKILVVDDDDLVRMMMVQALESVGHDIDECDDGIAAVAKIKQCTYDIIVTDVVMPGQSGVSVGEYVKNNDLPSAVLAVSAYANNDEGNALAFANYFADDILKKPFDKETFLTAVKKLSPGINIDSALQNM